MNQFLWFLSAISLAVIFDLYLISAWRRYRQLKQDHEKEGIPVSRWKFWKQAIVSEKIHLIIRSVWKSI